MSLVTVGRHGLSIGVTPRWKRQSSSMVNGPPATAKAPARQPIARTKARAATVASVRIIFGFPSRLQGRLEQTHVHAPIPDQGVGTKDGDDGGDGAQTGGRGH